MEIQHIHRLVPLLALILLGGCGRSSVQPGPTATHAAAVPMAMYRDPVFHFSFRYPANWRVSMAAGRYSTIAGIRTYILDVAIPHDEGNLTVSVATVILPFPSFKEGHIGRVPGDPHTFKYFHVRVSGWPSMYVKGLTGSKLSEVYTITNTPHRSYDIKMATARPPFNTAIVRSYRAIVASMKVPVR